MGMTITILAFAHAADAIGAQRLERDIEPGATAASVIEDLCREFAALRPLQPALAAAINDAYAPLDTTLDDGDTLALIPPVSGG